MAIYLDNAATTKVNPKVLEEVLPWFTENYGNASSAHDFGQICKNKIEEVREQVAEYLHGDVENVYFCSSSSEANSWFYRTLDDLHKNFAVLETDHIDSILATEELIHGYGLIPVNYDGLYDYYDLRAIKWICINLVNAETGVTQNIKGISTIAHEYGCNVFCDLTQAIGHMDIDIEEMGIDACSFGAHKIGGIKGCGVLYTPIKPMSLIFGHQENGTHGGTYNVPAIVSLGEALKLSRDNNYVTSIRDYFEDQVLKKFPNVWIVCKDTKRIGFISNICFPSVRSEVVQAFLSTNGIHVSSGSACNSYDDEPSHVLTALSLGELANNCIRFSFSEDNTKEEVDLVIKALGQILEVYK